MQSTFEPDQLQTTTAPAFSSEPEEDSPQKARITSGQQLLFPSSPRSVCDELGLPWQTAVRLQEDGWLSFSIETTSQLDETQEAELRFVGVLALAGCDRKMLGLLLAGLPRPYSYDLHRVYFDWASRHWRLLPDPRLNPEATFTDWVDRLAQTNDEASLVGIVELAQDALARIS
jgi:hypothetical protein